MDFIEKLLKCLLIIFSVLFICGIALGTLGIIFTHIGLILAGIVLVIVSIFSGLGAVDVLVADDKKRQNNIKKGSTS